MLIVRDYGQEFETGGSWTQPVCLFANGCAEASQEEAGASSNSPKSAGASSFTQGSPEPRTASAAKVRKPRKRKHAKNDLQTQVEQLLRGMKGDFEQLKEHIAALDQEQNTQAAELCQLKERLATASTCNIVLQCDLATFAEATQGTANELIWTN